jgi:hypothetical protein
MTKFIACVTMILICMHLYTIDTNVHKFIDRFIHHEGLKEK